MKRLALGLGLVGLLAVFAFPAFGWGPGWGHMYYGGGGPGYCWQNYGGAYGPGSYGNLSPDQAQKLDQLRQSFYSDTANLRNELWSKTAELNSLLNAPNPDEQQVQTLQKQINDLRAQLSDKRNNFELQARKISPEAGYAFGYGPGYGPRMGRGYGYGPGSCWN